jgi:ribosomal protein S13
MIPHLSIYKNLLNIKGFGPSSILLFLSSLGISPHSKFQDLHSFKLDLLLHSLASLRKSPHSSLLIDKLLQKNILDNISRYKNNFSYRGGRLSFGYPVRGQRTRSNAHTSKKFKLGYLPV